MHTNRERAMQTDTNTSRQVNSTQKDINAERQADRQTDAYRERATQTERQTDQDR